MKRNARNLWLAILVLCIACTTLTTVLLIRSYFQDDLFIWQHTTITNAAMDPPRGDSSRWGLYTGLGGFTLNHDSHRDIEQVEHPDPDWMWRTMIHPVYGLLSAKPLHFGFGFRLSTGPANWGFTLTFPGWLLFLLLASLSYAFFRRWRRGKPRIAAACAKCGYDLRASKERCPECGAPIPTAQMQHG
jgi:hypothetical protein